MSVGVPSVGVGSVCVCVEVWSAVLSLTSCANVASVYLAKSRSKVRPAPIVTCGISMARAPKRPLDEGDFLESDSSSQPSRAPSLPCERASPERPEAEPVSEEEGCGRGEDSAGVGAQAGSWIGGRAPSWSA